MRDNINLDDEGKCMIFKNEDLLKRYEPVARKRLKTKLLEDKNRYIMDIMYLFTYGKHYLTTKFDRKIINCEWSDINDVVDRFIWLIDPIIWSQKNNEKGNNGEGLEDESWQEPWVIDQWGEQIDIEGSEG